MKRKMIAIFGSALMLTLVSTNAQAQSAPGEGAYLGAFLGHGTGILSAKARVFDVSSSGNANRGSEATFESTRGGLGLSGIQGGGWFGFGLKTADDLYFGIEGSFAGSEEKIELTSSTGLQEDGAAAGENTNTITKITAERNWVGAGALRVGYYVNKDTLFALSGGVAVSQFDVAIGSSKETYYAGGPQVGGSITTNLTKIDPNLSLRMEVVYTNYLTADINGQDGITRGTGVASNDNDSELTGNDTAGRIGLTYRFNGLAGLF